VLGVRISLRDSDRSSGKERSELAAEASAFPEKSGVATEERLEVSLSINVA